MYYYNNSRGLIQKLPAKPYRISKIPMILGILLKPWGFVKLLCLPWGLTKQPEKFNDFKQYSENHLITTGILQKPFGVCKIL